MPGYVGRALQRFAHPKPRKPENAPYPCPCPDYGAKVQYVEPHDTTPALNAADVKRVQEVVGVFYYYARAVDNTMLAALGSLASEQANATAATMRNDTHMLNYAATHPEAKIRYHASDMVLWVHTDASYLSLPKGRSRAAGYHFLSSWPTTPPDATTPTPFINAPIDVLCMIMKNVLASAAEAKIGSTFLNT